MQAGGCYELLSVKLHTIVIEKLAFDS